jgi:hypothetical protein
VTALIINNINSAVAVALSNSKSANKTVKEYFQDLANIQLWNCLVYKFLHFGRIPYTIETHSGLTSTRLGWYLGVITGLRLSTKIEMIIVNNEIVNCNQINMLLVLDINICTSVRISLNTHHNVSQVHLGYSVRQTI